MSFPAGDRSPRLAYADPSTRVDYTIPKYQIDSNITNDSELRSTTRVHVRPRNSAERVLLFSLDSNLRVESVKSGGAALEFFQARERKGRYQSYGDYVAVVLDQPAQADTVRQIDFQYSGKRVVENVCGGNFFCQSFGWYPALFESRTGTGVFAFRSDFETSFKIPKKYSLIATGYKVSEKTDGDWLLTSWKSDVPLAVAGFAFGDYKSYVEKVGNTEIQVYANKRPDDLLRSIQVAYDDPIADLEQPLHRGYIRMPEGSLGVLNPASLAKTIGVETANTMRVFQSFFGRTHTSNSR